MAAKKRFNAVATVAAVAAFPVFPLFADEPTTAPDAAPQVAASADETSALERETAAFAEFNVSLFEIPDGETVEFYRERADEIEREWNRLALTYAVKQEELARKNSPIQPFPNQGRRLHGPTGTYYDGERYVLAPADSILARRADALADLYGRLADAPELPLEVRGLYYRNWIKVLSGLLTGKSPQECREFYAKLLADEKAKSPLDLGRVLYLSDAASFYPKDDAASSEPTERADLETLLAVPEGESTEFYLKRLNELNRA